MSAQGPTVVWQCDAVDVSWPAPYRVALPAAPAPSSGHPVLLALHGFGEDAARFGERFAPLAGGPYALLVPDGPFPVEVHEEGGTRVGRAWYQYDGDATRFEHALCFGAEHVRRVLETAAASHALDAHAVVLLGYSQGGYLAAVAALRDRARYRGLVAISTRVKSEILGSELALAQGYPVLALHGERDRSTPLEPQRRSLAALESAGLQVELVVHSGGHGFRAELLPHVDGFVRRALHLAPP